MQAHTLLFQCLHVRERGREAGKKEGETGRDRDRERKDGVSEITRSYDTSVFSFLYSH